MELSLDTINASLDEGIFTANFIVVRLTPLILKWYLSYSRSLNMWGAKKN